MVMGYLRAPGECIKCIEKCIDTTPQFESVVSGTTRFPATAMVMVETERLGMEDSIWKLAVGDGSHLKIHEVGADTRTYEGLRGGITALGGRRDGKLYCVGLSDGKLSVIRNDHGNLGALRTWSSIGESSISVVSFLSSNIHVVSIDASRQLCIWDLGESEKPVYKEAEIHSHLATSICPVLRDDKIHFYVGFEDGTIKLYRFKPGPENGTAPGKLKAEASTKMPSGPVSALGMLQKDLVAAYGSTITACDRRLKKELYSHQVHLTNITDMKCCKNGRIITCSGDGILKTITANAEEWRLVHRINAGTALTACACDDEGNLIGYADATGNYNLYRITKKLEEESQDDIVVARISGRPDLSWSGIWDVLMNKHEYRQALIKALSRKPSDSDFPQAMRVLESMIESNIIFKAADALSAEELCQVLEGLRENLIDDRVYWYQSILLSITRITLQQNSKWISQHAEEALVESLHSLLTVISPRVTLSFST